MVTREWTGRVVGVLIWLTVGIATMVGCTREVEVEPPCGKGTVAVDGVCVANDLVDASAGDSAAEDTSTRDSGTSYAVDVVDSSDGTRGADATEETRDGADSTAEDSGQNDGGDSGLAAGATIGGGRPYVIQRRRSGKATFCQPPSDSIVVESLSELTSALESAGSGDVVYVPGEVDINLEADGGVAEKITIPPGVTLASDRGCDGSEGGRIYFESDEYDPWPTFVAEDGARLVGLVLEGVRRDVYDPNGDHVSGGVRFVGGAGEVANCEFFGWGHFAIQAQNGVELHVHHSDIHHSTVGGTGYGVSVNNGSDVLIEYNRFNYNRHSIACGGGCGESSYTARYNHFGPDTIDHVIDAHRPGGHTIEVHHNTVEAVRCMSHPEDVDVGGCPPEGERTEAVTIRGTPSNRAWIHHNWFYNPNEPSASPDGYTGEAIAQQHTDAWQNVEFDHNHYGDSEPDSCDIGAPREGCPAP